ncbi:protein of unknown function [Ruminococcaceae bacterium BL-6]|nr:protein of unknown function [Ruminococcaceae bacterium BL-6]
MEKAALFLIQSEHMQMIKIYVLWVFGHAKASAE